ncbi:MAG: Lrp/AsnC family transcriptional regulator [Methylacidiphilales bacterium]|nr:Lrp/AsnC family transcriptional regulator [Candidatus Methylacidiphilales bacterium]MDW8348780.1 Lrp/AsnC family transcriptional regulator [Verrucomicrobiae bacterium]
MTTTSSTPIPVSTYDPINAAILAVSEDRIQGFHRKPFAQIAALSGVPYDVVVERIRAMLEAGTIRRVRLTLIANDLAPGALVAWRVAQERLDAAFDWLWKEDPFSGHIVIRSTDTEAAGSTYKLWTTLKVPQGFSLEEHCECLQRKIGAEAFRIMPAKGIFVLGVGHVRRREIKPGSKSDTPAEMHEIKVTRLSDEEWHVLSYLKRECMPHEIGDDLWLRRAEEAGLDYERFCAVAEGLADKKIIGRFSTFLEHVKPNAAGERVTKFNALFHWAVPPGLEKRAGEEVGRFHALTHCYWREAGPEFKNVNIMAVAHGTDKELVKAHKAAIDAHLNEVGIPVLYTNIFWGGRSEIKPSEILPSAYAAWRRQQASA